MKDHFKVIRTLSKPEFSRFGDFLDSPFFNTSSRLVEYYLFLKKNYRKYIELGLTKDEIKKGFLKAKTLSDASKAETNYRKLVSDFNKKLEEFLVLIKHEPDDIKFKLKLLNELRKRDLTERFESLSIELDDYFKLKTLVNSEDYADYKNFLEAVRLYTFSTDYHSASNVVQSESDLIDYMFISYKLGAFQNMFSLEYVNKKNKHNWTFFEEISRFIESNLDTFKKSHPASYFNYAILKLAKDPNDDQMYLEVKSFLFNNLEHLQPDRLKRFTFDLINYCYLKVNEGNPEFRQEIHSLIIFLDENNLLLADGEINHSYFKIALDNSISIRELSWLEYFIDKYSGNIELEYRDNLTNLAYTKLYLYKGDYDKARYYESKVNFKDYIHYMDTKLTLVRIEYESGNIDSILSIFDSVKKFLTKNSNISEYYSFFYNNFISIMSRFLKIKERAIRGKNIEFELDKIKADIKNEKRPFHGKLWILQEIDNLK